MISVRTQDAYNQVVGQYRKSSALLSRLEKRELIRALGEFFGPSEDRPAASSDAVAEPQFRPEWPADTQRIS